jgi:hypothetical protein
MVECEHVPRRNEIVPEPIEKYRRGSPIASKEMLRWCVLLPLYQKTLQFYEYLQWCHAKEGRIVEVQELSIFLNEANVQDGE